MDKEKDQPPRAPNSAPPCPAAKSSWPASNAKAWTPSSPIPAAPAWKSTRRSPNQDPHRPAAARAGRRFCRGRLCAGDRQGRRVHGHQRPRRDQPRHRHRRRLHGFLPAHRHHRPGAPGHDRQGRFPGDRHLRHDAAGREAQLPDHGHQRHSAHRQRGVLHRADRPARPGAD